MTSPFDSDSASRLVECLTDRNRLEEASHRSKVSRKKLIDAANAGVEDMKPLIQELLAAHEQETRAVVRHLQNGVWLKNMKAKIRTMKTEGTIYD